MKNENFIIIAILSVAVLLLPGRVVCADLPADFSLPTVIKYPDSPPDVTQPADSSQPKAIKSPASPPDVMPPAATTTNTGRPLPASGDVSQKSKDIASPETAAKAVNLSPDVSALPVKVEVSDIEKAVATLEKGGAKPAPQPYQAQMLTQFGYSFFRPSAAGFAPLTDIPVGPDYVIGPGDRIVLNLWGSIEGTHELEVNRSGEIILPRVGGVQVWGLTFARLPEVLKSKLSKVFKDF